MSQAMSETVAYVNRARAFMPPGTVPPFVMRFDAGSVPVGNLVFSSDTRTVGEMQDAALNLGAAAVCDVAGRFGAAPFGGSARSIVVNLKPDRLRSYNLSPDDVVSAMTSANCISPSGNMPINGKYPMVPLNSVVKNIKDLESVPIRAGTYPTIFARRWRSHRWVGYHHMLRTGQWPPDGLHTGDQKGRGLDTHGGKLWSGRTCPNSKHRAERRQGQL